MSNTLHLDDLGSPSGEDPKPKPNRKRISPLTVVGVVLLVAGLSCLGWVGYQYFGTNVVSRKAFEQEKQDLRQQWSQQDQAPATHKSDKSKDKDKAPAKKVIEGDAIALMRIPKFGSDYEIPVLSGIDEGTLARGIGHYPGTAMPGQVGNFAVAGHRITHGQPFSRLLELNKGDQVIVETRTEIYTYVLDTAPRDLTVEDTATWVIDPVPGKPTQKPSDELLTLTTCQDLFHSADRSIGFGHLVDTQDK